MKLSLYTLVQLWTPGSLGTDQNPDHMIAQPQDPGEGDLVEALLKDNYIITGHQGVCKDE